MTALINEMIATVFENWLVLLAVCALALVLAGLMGRKDRR